MLHELGIKMPKSEKQIKEDPYLIIGYGINAFFDILLSLCTMFCMISIAAIPIFFIYSSMGQGTYSDEKSYPISKFLLGNMGGASVFCHSGLMEKSHMDLSCPTGTFFDGSKALFGLISTEHE